MDTRSGKVLIEDYSCFSRSETRLSVRELKQVKDFSCFWSR